MSSKTELASDYTDSLAWWRVQKKKKPEKCAKGHNVSIRLSDPVTCYLQL